MGACTTGETLVNTNLERAEIPDAAPPAIEARTLFRWPQRLFGRGATTGLRCAAYLAFLIEAIAILADGVLALFLAGAGCGWGVPGLSRAGSFVCGAILALGFLIGALFDFVSVILLNRPQAPAARTTKDTPRPWRRRLRRILTAAAALLAVLSLGLAFGLGARVRGYLAEMHGSLAAVAARDDPHWQIPDIVAHRNPVPDQENSALVVKNLAVHLPRFAPDGRTPIGVALRRDRDTLSRVPETSRLDPALARTLRHELEACAAAVKIARSLKNYSAGGYSLELGPAIYDTPLSHLGWVWDATSLLLIDSAIRAEDEGPDAALESCLAIFQAARSIGDEPFATSQLVRFKTGGYALAAVRRVLAQGEASEVALGKLQAVALDELDQPLMIYALRGERASLVEILRRLGSGKLTLEDLADGFHPDTPRRSSPMMKFWLQIQEAVVLRWMNDVMEIEKLPYADRTSRWAKWVYRLEAKPDSPRFWVLLHAIKLFPAVQAAALLAALHRADLGATALLLAAERYRRKHGRWPVSIEAIDKDILSRAPDDPFTGQPYRLLRKEREILIYSVGVNKKDEHGEHHARQYSPEGPDDIAARAWDVPQRRR